ncbi:MAG TPA: 16S rRNA (cytidine(1402)-2'-O)-methyltransferase [Candidatus Wirthbacteria bacterium]|nr:16S rRNA (cytidine(1402)-2'-O)-methyltransferase [Candidatus Wirthbacteria bacterium]
MTDNPKGILYLVSTPIGHPDDLTLRARRILGEVDLVVGEEFKESSKLLRSLGIKTKLAALNEHNETDNYQEVISVLRSGQDVALISDCGTPVLADPGSVLVSQAIKQNIQVVPIPGPSSILAALVVCGFKIHRWHYRGFLSPKREERQAQLMELRDAEYTTIILEAPYRLRQILEDMEKHLQPDRQLALCWQLTMPDEEVIRGSIKEVRGQVEIRGWKKGEFVIVLAPY